MRGKCYWVKQSWSEMSPVLMLAGKKNIKHLMEVEGISRGVL